MSNESSSAASNEILQLRHALAEALKDREAAWNEQARLVNEITALKAQLKDKHAKSIGEK